MRLAGLLLLPHAVAVRPSSEQVNVAPLAVVVHVKVAEEELLAGGAR